jgi:replicative DNA helicase
MVTGIKLEPDCVDDYYGFEIDGDRLFLLEDMTVTHNTAICLNFGANIAQAGLPVAVFSLEMSQRQLAYRLTSSHSQIGISHLRTGRVADHEWGRLGESICTQSDWPLYIDDTPSPSLSHILSQCRRLKAQKGDLGMVFIDYLQLMDFSNGRDDGNESQQLGKLTRKLKGMARELDTPVVVLSQLSRGVESRSDKRPVMSDLRSSGAIEQDADIVMMLYREEYYDAQTTERGIAEVIIRKNRNGPIGTAKLLFQPEISKFRNLAHV